ncbi:MAG: Intein-containing protein [Candidatus Kaiserbacteria bacterium GW2011_GWA2_58_9]|uniref:Intein-containing protein n=1 Tax=Candidatus Kaiserbacteria bacterium GW2011_GWA2_58_9 TaxID=1618672 RepID=A0A0G1YPX6_9BACT|nr:MAG: Intein-containing protein [Candidatus Kaiserbacteria bacterium GW2011_GWA2_58_9]
MGKRGPKPKRLISEKWTPELAYAIGLLATDGCLATKVHLVDLTSKDREQLKNFCTCIGLDLKISRKSSGRVGSEKNYLRVQFKNVIFYNFLISIGLTPAKSKTLGALSIPPQFFWDFLRGVYDGDGSSYAYWDPRWRSSYMFYTSFASASRRFVDWIRDEINQRTGVPGHMSTAGIASDAPV